jgi:hypothetical protein
VEPPVIEVLSSASAEGAEEGPCQAPSGSGGADGGLLGVTKPHYGFNRQYSGVFAHLREELTDVLRLPDPERTPEAQRSQVGG